MHYNNLPGLLICVNFEKAFDSADWNFMMKVLKTFGFRPIICQIYYIFCKKFLISCRCKMGLFRHGLFLTKEDVVKAVQFHLICFCYVWKFGVL